MHRSLHTVARRRIYPSNRTFSSSSLLSNEPGQSGEPGSKPQLKATPRVPRASSLGGIDLCKPHTPLLLLAFIESTPFSSIIIITRLSSLKNGPPFPDAMGLRR